MPRMWQIIALVTFAVMAIPSRVLADNDILAPRFDLGLWTIVIFVLLLLLLRKTAWGPMLEGLQRRESVIRDSVEEARRTRDEMEQMRNQFKSELDAAHAQIPKMMEEARKNAERMGEEMRAKANEEINAEKQRARHELQVAKDQALQELWNQTAMLATQISSKAIGRALTEDDHRRLVDEALQEISQTNGAHG